VAGFSAGPRITRRSRTDSSLVRVDEIKLRFVAIFSFEGVVRLEMLYHRFRTKCVRLHYLKRDAPIPDSIPV